MKMKCCHVNDGVNRIQKQVRHPRNRNFEAGILTDAPALVAAASNIALTLPKSGSRGDSGLASMSNVILFADSDKSLLGIRKRR